MSIVDDLFVDDRSACARRESRFGVGLIIVGRIKVSNAVEITPIATRGIKQRVGLPN